MKGKYKIKKMSKCDHRFMLIETDKNFIWKCKKCGIDINEAIKKLNNKKEKI